MSRLVQIGKGIWVAENGKGTIRDHYSRRYDSAPKKDTQETIRHRLNREKDYRRFCRRIFSEAGYYSLRQINALIRAEIGRSETYYRKRMQELGFLKFENNLYKPGIKITIPKNPKP